VSAGDGAGLAVGDGEKKEEGEVQLLAEVVNGAEKEGAEKVDEAGSPPEVEGLPSDRKEL
jgi:hypothetical protein